MTTRVSILLLAVFTACSRGPGQPVQGRGPVTTDGTVARSNLDAMIESHERMISRNRGRSSARASLVTLLIARASTYGRLQDYDRAEQLAEEGITWSPGAADAWMARASSRAALHQFHAALSDLERAAALGATADGLGAARTSIALALGEATHARSLAETRVARQPDLESLSALGVVLAETDSSASAAAVFRKALEAYRDTSPFPVAFIEFREGLLAEGTGDLQGAQERYRAALHRLPGHAQAALHLANIALALDAFDEAEAALGTLLPEASDPEIPAMRAELARKQGRAGEAERWASTARERYRALLAKHPDAFADHAARFLLDREPLEALHWARRNVEVRPTADALDLALTAALRAGDVGARCQLALRAETVEHNTRRLEVLVGQARAQCPARQLEHL